MAKNAYDKLSWDKKEEIIKRKLEAKLKKVELHPPNKNTT